MILRDYQEQAIREIKAAFFERSLNRLLVVHPTGSGKTVLFSHLLVDPDVQAWMDGFPIDQRKVLVIAHREELLEQAAGTIKRALPSALVEIERGPRRASVTADVVVASIASIGRQGSDRLQRFGLDRFRVVIVDEAHHAAAPTYLSVIKGLGGLPGESSDEQRRVLVLGVTATSDRLDKIGLGAVFDEIVDSRSIRELMDANVLSPLRAYRIRTETRLDTLGTARGDFRIGELSQAVNQQARNIAAVKTYQDWCTGRQAIVFGVDVAHAIALAQAFSATGIRADVVYGDMGEDQRTAVLEAFKRREIQILTNCMVLTEGFDAPHVSCIIQARPTQSRLLYMQMIGRGTRRSEGKEDCIVLDLVDHWAKHSVVTIASLFGLPPRFGFNGESVLDVANQFDQAVVELDGLPPMSLEDVQIIASPVPLWDPTDPAKSWIESAPEVFQVLLGGEGQERVIVRRRQQGWQIQSRLQRFKYEGLVPKHISRIEAPGGMWPPLEFDQFCPSASAARAIVEAAAVKRQRAREQFTELREAILRVRLDLKELEDDTQRRTDRVDRFVAGRFSEIVAALEGTGGRRAGRSRRRLKRFRFTDDHFVLYRLDQGLRLQSVIRCDAHGCDVFVVPDLPTPDRVGLATLLRGLRKYLPIDSKNSHQQVQIILRDHLDRHGWESFLGECQELSNTTQSKLSAG